MATRCKMKLIEIRDNGYGRTLVFQAEYDKTIPEDQRFCEATPNARLEIYCNNKNIYKDFEVLKFYYIDVSPATPLEPVKLEEVKNDHLSTKPHVHARGEPSA